MANLFCAVKAVRATSTTSFQVVCEISSDTGASGDTVLTVAQATTGTVAQLNNAIVAAATSFASTSMGLTLSGGDKLVLIGAFV